MFGCRQANQFVSFFCISLCFLMGCSQTSDGPERFDLSGKATFNGEPIPNGNIMFEPDTEKGNSGPGSYAEIRDGQYKIEPGKGLVGGAYLARINGYDGVPYKTGEGMSATGKPLFSEQVLHIEVPKEDSTQDLDVKAPGKKK